MNREIYKLVIIGVVLNLTVGCKTSSTGAQVDLVRGEVDLYTSADGRSSLTKADQLSNVKEAEVRLRAAAKNGDGDMDAMVNLAQVQVAQGKFRDAEKTCRDILRRDLKNAPARIALAQIALREGNGDLAEIILNGVGGTDSKDSGVLNMLAMIELDRGNNASAMALFNKAIKTNGRDLAARMNLGVLQLKYRQVAAAATQFERVLRALPDHRDAKLHLGIVRAAQSKQSEAIDLFREVLNDDSKNPIALYNLAVVQQEGEDYDDALDNLKSYLTSTRGKAVDNDHVFALIDSIQRQKAAGGEEVTDDDIQAMAAQMATGPQDQPQQVAQAEGSDESMTAEPEHAEIQKTAVQERAPGLEDVESLEAQLLE